MTQAFQDDHADPDQAGATVLDLEVLQLRRESDRVLSVILADPERRLLPVWAPGAHIDLWLPGCVRQYSLCGDPENRREYRIAVLRENDSRGGSRYIHDVLRPGQVVEVSGPRNHFELQPATEYVFVAGGIGITPLLAMLRTAGENWRLIYGGQSRRSMAFLDEVEGDPRVQILPQDEYGLLNLTQALGDPRTGVGIYCCGPSPLIAAMEGVCADWPRGTLHVEHFAAADIDTSDDVAFDIVAERSGLRVTVQPRESALDALEAAGIGVPYACRTGVCGSCESRVLAGVPEHRDSLTDPEATDVMMPCVSRARTPELVLDI